MSAYYNEFDPYAAEWLRNLIKAGHIADGEVDTRSIVDVQPNELRSFTQCHFFAGIAGWSYALRLAGWADERQIWTGSCPCQPFSVAGKGAGVNDERHLWPHFFRLIREVRPPIVMGEQVAGAAGYGWLDGVQSDLESESYSCEGVDIPACAIDAPHMRSRLYWVANTQSIGRRQGTEDIRGLSEGNREEGATRRFTVNNHSLDTADASDERSQGRLRGGQDTQRENIERYAGCDSAAYGSSENVEHANAVALEERGVSGEGFSIRAGSDAASRNHVQSAPIIHGEAVGEGMATSGFWHNAIWLDGADGKKRRAEPSIRLLAHGVPARVGKLRAYGNAIVPPLAAEVIKAFMQIIL